VKSVGSLHWLVRMIAGRQYTLFRSTFGMSTSTRRLLVDGSTNLVIEGFPRSANTYAVVAFQKSGNPGCRIAHHLHVSCQITEGLKKGVPVCLLLRAPADAARSLVTREPGIGVQAALLSYSIFHQPLLALRDKIVIAQFDEVTKNFGAVIERINSQCGTKFSIDADYKGLEADVFTKVDELNVKQRRSEESVARPSAQKEKMKSGINIPEGSRFLRDAEKIYELLRG
jgi:hypothetical protein